MAIDNFSVVSNKIFTQGIFHSQIQGSWIVIGGVQKTFVLLMIFVSEIFCTLATHLILIQDIISFWYTGGKYELYRPVIYVCVTLI